MPNDGRSYVTGYFALDLDGLSCGVIRRAEGGDLEGGPRIGSAREVRYSDITVQTDLAVAQPVKDWIEASFARNDLRKSGEIKRADFKRQVREIREFKDALLTEIGFPAADGGAKDPAFMSLKFSPWVVRNKPGDGSTVTNPADAPAKSFHPADFRFDIDGLETACLKVQRIDAITVKQKAVRDRAGLSPGTLELPNLKVTLPEEYAKPFFAWLDDFTTDAPGAKKKPRNGRLVYLDRTRRKELLTLTFSGLGIFKVSAAPRVNNADRIASVTVEMSCERIQAKFA